MTGGEIVVTGDAGEEAGAGMRRGLVAVGGRTGNGAGLRMLAGTVIALGGIGDEAGLGNKRGSLVVRSSVGAAAERMRLPLASGRRPCVSSCSGCASSGCPWTTRFCAGRGRDGPGTGPSSAGARS